MPSANSKVTDKRSDEEGDEGKLADSQREPVHLDVDKRESFKPGVEDGIDETLEEYRTISRLV